MEDKLISGMLLAHVIAGGVTLLAGLVAILSKKGSAIHRLAGKVYFISMSVIFITAMVVGYLKGLIFLILVGVFSYQLVVTGYRSLYHKKVHRKGIPTIDYLILGSSALGDLGLIGISIWLLMAGDLMGIAAGAFGLIGLMFVRNTWRKFTNLPTDKKHWLHGHVAGMLGSYIAAVTAFLVTNFEFNPPVVLWLLPAAIGSPLIAYYIRKNSRQQ